MPGYIGYTPQFNPISLQDYLTVPTAIIQGRQQEADKLENYKTEAERLRALMGNSPRAQAIWSNYDNIIGTLADDMMSNKISDIAKINRKLKDSFRDIKTKAESAYTRRTKDQELLRKNPDLIGEVGDFMDYYDNEDYDPNFIDGTKVSKVAESLTSRVAQSVGTRPTGQYIGNPKNGQVVYHEGLTATEIADAFDNVKNNKITTPYEQYLAGLLNSFNYYNADPIRKRQIEQYFYQGMQKGSGFKTRVVDELGIRNKQLSIQEKINKRVGTGKGKNSLVYEGVVSASPTGKVDEIKSTDTLKPEFYDNFITDPAVREKLDSVLGGREYEQTRKKVTRKTTRDENVNLTDAELPDYTKEISPEEAKQNYHEQYYDLFSNTEQKGYELESNAKYYKFYIDADEKSGDNNLYIVPSSAPVKTSGEDSSTDLNQNAVIPSFGQED